MQEDANIADKGRSTNANPVASNSALSLDHSITAANSSNFNWEMTELLNHINVGFYSRDIVADRYIRLSEGCPKIYGYNLQDFYDNSQLWYDVILPEDRQVVNNESDVLESGNKSVTEYRIYHKDGSIRWLEVKALPILHDGRLVRVDGIVSDITQRKNFELEILEANKLSQIIMDSLPGIFYMYDDKGRFKYWNKNFSEVTGYSDAEIKSLHPLELFDKEDRGIVSETIDHVFVTGSGEIELSLLTKDGSLIPYYFNGHKFTYRDDVFLVGVGVDSTQRKKAKEELRKSQQMLAHVLNSIPQAIFWKDVNSVFKGCNTVFLKAAGFSDASSVIGRTDFELTGLYQESEDYRAEDVEVMETKKAKMHFEKLHKQHDGELRWHDVSKIPLKNQNNEVDGILGIWEDITDRKLEDEKLHKLNEELIQKNIDLKQFSYIVSHNLRSPISKILGLASLLEGENDQALNKELVEYIASEAHNLDQIVKDLNTIVGAQDIGNKTLEDIFFEDELRLIERSIDNEINQSKATISADFTRAKSVKSVRAYFYSILYNLLSNAIKYRDPERLPVIQIETLLEGQYVCMIVKDNGLGIDMEKYGNKIFGLYNRFHVGVIPGKGIGLNLVKTQAESLGGRVELSAKAGEGCTFKVYFPLV